MLLLVHTFVLGHVLEGAVVVPIELGGVQTTRKHSQSAAGIGGEQDGKKKKSTF